MSPPPFKKITITFDGKWIINLWKPISKLFSYPLSWGLAWLISKISGLSYDVSMFLAWQAQTVISFHKKKIFPLEISHLEDDFIPFNTSLCKTNLTISVSKYSDSDLTNFFLNFVNIVFHLFPYLYWDGYIRRTLDKNISSNNFWLILALQKLYEDRFQKFPIIIRM